MRRLKAGAVLCALALETCVRCAFGGLSGEKGLGRLARGEGTYSPSSSCRHATGHLSRGDRVFVQANPRFIFGETGHVAEKHRGRMGKDRLRNEALSEGLLGSERGSEEVFVLNEAMASDSEEAGSDFDTECRSSQDDWWRRNAHRSTSHAKEASSSRYTKVRDPSLISLVGELRAYSKKMGYSFSRLEIHQDGNGGAQEAFSGIRGQGGEKIKTAVLSYMRKGESVLKVKEIMEVKRDDRQFFEREAPQASHDTDESHIANEMENLHWDNFAREKTRGHEKNGEAHGPSGFRSGLIHARRKEPFHDTRKVFFEEWRRDEEKPPRRDVYAQVASASSAEEEEWSLKGRGVRQSTPSYKREAFGMSGMPFLEDAAYPDANLGSSSLVVEAGTAESRLYATSDSENTKLSQVSGTSSESGEYLVSRQKAGYTKMEEMKSLPTYR